MKDLRFYAGIGSRKAPEHILKLMTEYAEILEALGYCLRSGGAIGSDQAFENGASNKVIFLPEQNPPKWTEVFTIHFHPRPDRLSIDGWQYMCRNAMQILGREGNDLVDFVLCWTEDGKASGGTGQAIRIAQAYDVPVYNLYNDQDSKDFLAFLYELYREKTDEN